MAKVEPEKRGVNKLTVQPHSDVEVKADGVSP